MKLTLIEWKFASLAGDTMDLKCAGCNGGQAECLAELNINGVVLNLPVCESCSELPEETLIKQITGGE